MFKSKPLFFFFLFKAKEFGQFWQDYKSDPLEGRNFILSSICPQVFGMYIVKLAAALVLAGGVQVCLDFCMFRLFFKKINYWQKLKIF